MISLLKISINSKKLFLIIIIFFIFSVNFAQADEINCKKKIMGQSDLNECSYNESQEKINELNSVYKKLMEKISKPGKFKLRKAEDAWILYRARQCDFNTFGTVTGSVNPMVVNDCYNELTYTQIKVLKAQLDCEEGNLGCGGQ